MSIENVKGIFQQEKVQTLLYLTGATLIARLLIVESKL